MSESWLAFDLALLAYKPHRNVCSVDYGGYPNCFFLSAKSQLNTNDSVPEMRQKLAEYVKSYPPNQFTLETVFDEVRLLQADLCPDPSDISLDTYVALLRADLIASDIEINATCVIYNAKIAIYSLGDDGHTHVQLHGDEFNANLIELAFHCNHYRAIESSSKQVFCTISSTLPTKFTIFHLIVPS
jgi:hypothetical protein